MRCPECGFENKEGSRFCGSCGNPLSQGEAPGATGGAGLDRIDKYEIVGELGHGAMARVWRAYDPTLDREVAIKVPLFDASLDQVYRDELGRRFVEEAHIAARLNHPNIVTVYAADVYDGVPAIVMELVEGSTLADLLDAGPLDPGSARVVLNELLDAVGYAHSQGAIHRDIKPENVFIDRNNHVKLADFGIARMADSSRDRRTVVGTVLGTPGYMSPEQAQGVREVDGRSDLFSVGVVGYEMLAGYNPFCPDGMTDSTTLLYRIVHEPVPDLSAAAGGELPESMRVAILAALEKDPDRRPQSAEQFKDMLNNGLYTVGPQDVPDLNKRSSNKWLPYLLVGAVGIIAILIIFISANSFTSHGVTTTSSGEKTTQETTAATTTTDSGNKSTDGSSTSTSTSNANSSTASSSDAEAKKKAESDAKKAEEERKAAEQASKGQYPPEFTDATASSELEPGDGYTFYATHVLNGSTQTAWNEGVDGDGIGQWIMLTASSPQLVKGFRLINGYPISENNYWNNNRVRSMSVDLSDGYHKDFDLADTYDWQNFDFGGEHTITSLKITITAVYGGQKYDDTCITSVIPY